MIKIKNDEMTPVADINAQMREMRPLPMGRADFDEWAERIISGALVPGAAYEDQVFALADLITHLGPTESHKPDAYFIHCLRKFAANQVAVTVREELYYKKHPEKYAEKIAREQAARDAAEKTLNRVGEFQAS